MGCGGEIVDALMGHWAFGEELRIPYSTFNSAVYFNGLKPYLGSILKEYGFRSRSQEDRKLMPPYASHRLRIGLNLPAASRRSSAHV
jgi:hypothetical protein